jgi:accessory gene regulator protein AgrB
MAQVVEYLPSKYEALCLNTIKLKKRKRKQTATTKNKNNESFLSFI